MGATEKLASFVVNTNYAGLPPEAIKTAKKQILDTVGVSLFTCKEPIGEIIMEYVKEVAAKPQARVIGYGFKTSSPDVALADGTLAHGLDYDDVGGYDHPSCTLVSAILPLSEEHNASGQDVIEAFVLGYEVGTRLFSAYTPRVPLPGTGMSIHEKGLHGTGIFGAVAAAASCAKILRLDMHKTIMAMGIAAAQAAGIWQSAGTMSKPLMVGNAARIGLVSARLAQKGFTGDDTFIEAPAGFLKAFSGGTEYYVEKVTENLGSSYSIVSPGPGIKVYPCCGGTHSAIDGMLKIVREHHITPEQVESVESIGMDCNPHLLALRPSPRTGYEAKFNVPFTAAMALLHGEVTQSQFNEATLFDPGTQEVMKKIKHTQKISRTEPLVVTVKLKNGQSYTATVAKATGHVGNPLTDETVYNKYLQCAAKMLTASNAERSLEMLQNLDKVKNIKQLMDVVTLPS